MYIYHIYIYIYECRTFGIVLLVLRVVKKTHSVQGLSLKTQQVVKKT